MGWLADNVNVIQADLPVPNGQLRLSEHKIHLGALDLECGMPLQKFVRDKNGKGHWRDIAWETSVSVGAGTQLAVRCKGVKNLKNWELHEAHLDV
jgi:hypothetical protein